MHPLLSAEVLENFLFCSGLGDVLSSCKLSKVKNFKSSKTCSRFFLPFHVSRFPSQRGYIVLQRFDKSALSYLWLQKAFTFVKNIFLRHLFAVRLLCSLGLPTFVTGLCSHADKRTFRVNTVSVSCLKCIERSQLWLGTLSSIAAIFLNLLKLEGVFRLDIRFRLSPYYADLFLCERRCNYTGKSSSSKKLARKTRKTYSQNRLNNLSSNCILNSNGLIYSLISACFADDVFKISI